MCASTPDKPFTIHGTCAYHHVDDLVNQNRPSNHPSKSSDPRAIGVTASSVPQCWRSKIPQHACVLSRNTMTATMINTTTPTKERSPKGRGLLSTHNARGQAPRAQDPCTHCAPLRYSAPAGLRNTASRTSHRLLKHMLRPKLNTVLVAGIVGGKNGVRITRTST